MEKKKKMANNFLKNDKLSKKMLIQHPGEDDSTDFYKDLDTEPFMTLWSFNRPFQFWDAINLLLIIIWKIKRETSHLVALKACQ